MNSLSASDIWISFVNDLHRDNRFFPDHNIQTYLENICTQFKTTIEINEILYRARTMSEDDIFMAFSRRNQPFYGFDKENSYMPPINQTVDGRANVNGISCLYLAREEETALIEVRPILSNKVSIAEIQVLSQLSCVDLTIDTVHDSQDINISLKNYIDFWFSMPVQHYEKDDYIPTQYIASYIKHKGYDGIIYKSSLNPNGKNVALFDGSKAAPISSRVVSVCGMGISARSVLPKGDKLIVYDNGATI